MVSANNYLKEFRAPPAVEWTVTLSPTEPVDASLSIIEDGQVDERDATTVPSITRTWMGKLYVDVCPLERRTWVVTVHGDRRTGGNSWEEVEPVEGLKVRVDAGDVLYVNLRPGGESTVGVDRR